MRRFTRLTNGFSNNVETTPIVTDRLWTVDDIVGLPRQPTFGPRGPYKKKPKTD